MVFAEKKGRLMIVAMLRGAITMLDKLIDNLLYPLDPEPRPYDPYLDPIIVANSRRIDNAILAAVNGDAPQQMRALLTLAELKSASDCLQDGDIKDKWAWFRRLGDHRFRHRDTNVNQNAGEE